MAALRVWVVTDGRLGHLNQLRGLLARLAVRTELELCTLDLSQQRFRCSGKQGLKRQFAAAEMPHWIIGAGSASHWPMIWCRWLTGARTLVLMKPDWPLWFFDAACIPAHDAPPNRANVLITQGVLNTMEPRVGGRELDRGLVLLGGINRHFHWDDDAVCRQVLSVVGAAPEIQWLVSDSPRTPGTTLAGLARQCPDNLQILPHQQTGPDWLKDQLSTVGRVWVSCDSVSMVYECITSGAPTGLLSLTPSRDSRVTRGMARVAEQGLALSWQPGSDNVLPEPARRLWEADRAAEWLWQWTKEDCNA